jgi:hypothetical protein
MSSRRAINLKILRKLDFWHFAWDTAWNLLITKLFGPVKSLYILYNEYFIVVINNLHSVPIYIQSQSCKFKWCGNRFENENVELSNGFSIPRNSEQPSQGHLSNSAVIWRARTLRSLVTFHGSKTVMMPASPNKEKEGNNHDRRPMVSLKRKGAINSA